MTLRELFRDKTDSSAIQFLRSVLASNLSFLLDFCLCLAFVGIGRINYLVATVMSFTAGSVLNYYLSALWIFEGDKDERKLELAAFLAISFVGLALNALGMYFFTGLLHFHYLLSRVTAACLVFFFNFSCKKRFVFGALARLALAHRSKRG
jgi:putative flippase GtrA